MKEKIKLYYNLEMECVKDNLYYLDGIYYQFLKWNRTEKEYEELIEICNELNHKMVKFSEIILNINNNFISDGYILLKLNYFLDDVYDLKDILNFDNKLYFENNNVNWLEMWKNKVDYLEYQVKELAHNKKNILSSFSYYVGLAENAISLLSINNDKFETQMVLSRMRVAYPNYCNDYFNPLSFIIDSRIRDISEYLKSKFFSNNDIYSDLEVFFKEQLNSSEYFLFFVRMLYPSYYFDLLENILLENKDEDSLIGIISRVNEYEEVLKFIALKVSQRTNMELLSWLFKKE